MQVTNLFVLVVGLYFDHCVGTEKFPQHTSGAFREKGDIDVFGLTSLPINSSPEWKWFLQHAEEIKDWIYIFIAQEEVEIVRITQNPSVNCQLCLFGAHIAMEEIRAGNWTEDFVGLILPQICVFLRLNGIDREVCNGIVELYLPHVFKIIHVNPGLEAIDVCSFFTGGRLGPAPCGEPEKTYIHVAVDTNKPILGEPLPYLPANVTTLPILHLTDIHPDLHYTVGSNTDCDRIMCCRPEDGSGTGDYPAREHGEYSCDMPESAMVDLFQAAKAQYDNYEFVIMSGDLVHHSFWNTNISDNLAHFHSVNERLVSLFPNIPIYPVIGNHEPHPCNLAIPSRFWNETSDFDQSWMYNDLADAYVAKLPQDAHTSYRTKGYYTVLHKPGFRIIALNSNLGYTANWWLMSDLGDHEGQLQWLHDTLLDAERVGEKVYIIGHIPPGGADCWKPWSEKFAEIVVRFEATVLAQFYGHNHNDQTILFFDTTESPPRPANSYFVGVSGTAYTNLNPGYKVYFAEEQTWEMVDHETWVYNLSLANSDSNNSPVWYKLYSAREEFGLRSLRPADLYDDLVVRMLYDGALFQKYQRAFYKDSHVAGKCTTVGCKLASICRLVTAQSGDSSHCGRLEELLLTSPAPTTTSTTLTTTTSTNPTTTSTSPTTTESSGRGCHSSEAFFVLFVILVQMFIKRTMLH